MNSQKLELIQEDVNLDLNLEQCPLLKRFVDLLKAKQIKGSNYFELQAGSYSTAIQSLNEDLWAYVSKLRFVTHLI